MSEKQARSRPVPKTLKLFLIIFALLLVPLVLQQTNVDRETLRLVGRIAVGVTALLFLYGVFTKLLKLMGLVVVILITLTILNSEGHLELPRLFADRAGSDR